MQVKTSRSTLTGFIAFFAVCFSTSPAHAQQSGLMLTPLNHTIKTKAGSRHTVTFSFINSLSTPQLLSIQIADLMQLPSGGAVPREAGTLPHSCAPWLISSDVTLAVAPRQTKVLTVNISVPGDAVGSYHAAIVVKMPEAVLPPGVAGASLKMQTLLPIHVVISGTERPGAEVKTAEFAPAEKVIRATNPTHAAQLRGKWALVPTVENTGNCMVRVKGDIIVTSQSGALVGRYRIGDGSNGQLILPGVSISFPILIDSTLPEIKYQARMNLSYSDKLGYSMPMELVPRPDGKLGQGEVKMGDVARTGLQAYVEPRVLIASAPVGSVRTERVTVVNLERFPITVTARASASTIDSDGTPILLQDTAAGGWISLSPPTFRLGAQQTRTVVLRLMAPADASDQWALVEFDFASASPKIALTATGRSVVLLRNSGNKDEAKVTLKSAALTNTPDGSVLSLSVVNGGQRPAAFSAGAVELMPAASAGITKVVLNFTPTLKLEGETNIVVLPGKMRRLDFLLPKNVGAGEYRGRLGLSPVRLVGRAGIATPTALDFNLKLAALEAGAKTTKPKSKSKTTPKPKAAVARPIKPVIAKTSAKNEG